MSDSKVTLVTFWKPFERWTEVKGNRIEHQWHADFEISAGEHLKIELWSGLQITPDHEIIESPPPGKIYRVHLKIALEEFDSFEGEIKSE